MYYLYRQLQQKLIYNSCILPVSYTLILKKILTFLIYFSKPCAMMTINKFKVKLPFTEFLIFRYICNTFCCLITMSSVKDMYLFAYLGYNRFYIINIINNELRYIDICLNILLHTTYYLI